MRLSPTLPSPDPVILAGVLDSAESHPPSLSAVPSDPSSPPPSEDLVDASPKSKIMLWMKAEFSSCYKEAVGLHQANSWDSTKEEFAAKREDYMELFSVQAPEAPPPLPPLLRTGNDYVSLCTGVPLLQSLTCLAPAPNPVLCPSSERAAVFRHRPAVLLQIVSFATR